METARKLKATRNDGLYDAFVREFLPDGGGGRSSAGARNARVRYHLDCDVLAKKGNFEHLLGKVETVRALGCCAVCSASCGYRCDQTRGCRLQGDRARVSDERIRLVVEACLRHNIHKDAHFEAGPRGSRQAGMRERLGMILNSMTNQEARAELLEKLHGVCGSGGAGAGPAEGGMRVGQGISAVGGAIRQQAMSVGQLLEQGAGQVRERLGSRAG